MYGVRRGKVPERLGFVCWAAFDGVSSLSSPLSRCAQITDFIANRDLPEMRIRLRSRDMGKVDDLFACERIDPGDGQVCLKFFGVPEFPRRDERMFVASRVGADGRGLTRADDGEPFDGVGSQLFARQGVRSLIVRSFRCCFEIGRRFVFAKDARVRLSQAVELRVGYRIKEVDFIERRFGPAVCGHEMMFLPVDPAMAITCQKGIQVEDYYAAVFECPRPFGGGFRRELRVWNREHVNAWDVAVAGSGIGSARRFLGSGVATHEDARRQQKKSSCFHR